MEDMLVSCNDLIRLEIIPMRITLLPGATPKKVLSARRVPLRNEKEANRTIEELVERGVITPVNETSDWCRPA